MRNMSFALTTGPVERQEKDVTRRLGWLFLKVGDFLQPVLKCMGLKPGEKIVRVGSCCIRVEKVSRERLDAITQEECVREGFPDMTPAEFVAMFCKTHRGCKPYTVITRIEFRYMPVPANAS
jgi:hypothetical protein